MSSDPFYWSVAWRQFRARILDQRPTCEVPGCTEKATQVDHVVTRAQDRSRELDPTNVQALCRRHHSSKTFQVDGAFGRRIKRPEDFRPRGCDANGIPMGSHRWRKT